jgi:hypothetical protein
MAYAIMRAKKLATMGSVAASMQHCYRERETHNADQERTPDNQHLGAKTTDEAMGKLRDMLPEKRRKDAVLAVEYVMTASPEWFAKATPEQEKALFQRSLQWLADKYGADRIITASIHRDEATPHLSAFVVPLTADKRLSAKEFIGDRKKMTADQTSYAAKMLDLGLERGIEGSKATHQRVQSFYGALERGSVSEITISAEAVTPKVLSKGMFSRTEEAPEAVAARLTAKLRDSLAPTLKNAAMAVQERRRAKEMQDTAQDKAKSVELYAKMFKGLNKDQVRELVVQSARMQQENAQEAETKRQAIKERFKDKADRDRSEDRGRGR